MIVKFLPIDGNSEQNMKIGTPPFAEITKISDDLAEVVAYEGVEVDVAKMEEFHDWFLKNLSPPFCILVNKINSYSYAFEALMNLADMKEIKAVAVISYKKISAMSTNLLKDFPRKRRLNIRMFETKGNALDWLHAELGKR